MTDIAAGKAQAHATGLAATLGHVRYVLGENRVTGFAFGLFVLIVLAALFGPYVVPYDPLASNTAQALKAAVGRALVRHRPARPRRAAAG